jgi:gamma-glutamyl-gamma-aminobutyrate hydrolase PuuD
MSGHPTRPLIGVTTYRQVTSWWAWERDAALVPGLYLDMVEAAGGQPVLLPPPIDRATDDVESAVERLVSVLDGLVLIGGGDIDARRYGHEPDPRNGGTNDGRDQLELALLAAAMRCDLPVLAVCRGLQILNVALGGDLVQQLPEVLGTTDHQPRMGAFGRVAVTTEPGTMVRTVLGERVEALCSHHQAIGRLGDGLVVGARSSDGVVEAVELPGHRFVIGVQWHPEEVGDTRLVEAMVAAIGAGATAGAGVTAGAGATGAGIAGGGSRA